MNYVYTAMHRKYLDDHVKVVLGDRDAKCLWNVHLQIPTRPRFQSLHVIIHVLSFLWYVRYNCLGKDRFKMNKTVQDITKHPVLIDIMINS